MSMPTSNFFLENYKNQMFPHSTELIKDIQSNVSKVISCSQNFINNKNLITTFETRHKIVSENKTEHAQSILNDINVFIKNLSKDIGGTSQLWIFFKEPFYNYSVFVNTTTNTVIGCIKSVDKRKLTKEEVIAFWGN
jgi:hypothetical protein